MEYEQFVQVFGNELKKKMQQENVQFYRVDSVKVNERKDALSIRYPNSPIAPMVYLDDKYKLYREGYSVTEIVEETAEQLHNTKENLPEIPELTKENARDKLYCVVINADANKDLLKNLPYEKLEDLAVVARFKVGEDGSFLVSNELCQQLQMTTEEVMELAHRNTEEQTYTCQSMSEIMREILEEEGMAQDYIDEVINMQEMDCQMYVLTNEEKIDGAVAIASKKVMEQAHKKVGEDYYVLPSSRHELILVPQDMVPDVKRLQEMVESINASEVKIADKLSDHVYKYDSLSKRVTLADGMESVNTKDQSLGIGKSHGRSH